MSRLAELKSASTLRDLAQLLNFTPTAFAYVVYKIPDESKYTTFSIPKRAGGMRTIQAPVPQLKLLQKNLSALLQDCWDEIQKTTGRKDLLSHGFRRARSIITNARKHRNRRFVFNVDIEDFFPSLNFGRVRGYFMKDQAFALDPSIATRIAQIACHENALPQGSPCSPVIANLIGHVLDVQLASLASRHGCTYSRYADDLTFSTNKGVFPAPIAEMSSHTATPGKALQKIVKRSGFSLNLAKTRMQYHDSRQVVTGLVVNRRVNVCADYRYTVRAMAHRLFMTGAYEIDSHGTTAPGTLEQLHGMLTFIDSVDLHHHYVRFSNSDKFNTLPEPISAITVQKFGTLSSQSIGSLTPRERLFRRFLIYKELYATPKPIIVCEGETDNIYLLHAIHSLFAKFPRLIGPPGTGASRLKVRLLRYVGTRTGRLLGLGSGGGGVLKTLIENYLADTERFKAACSKFPCILLLDNDSGSAAVEGILKKHGHSLPATGFLHVHKNLYVMRTPPLRGKPQTAIEDFFPSKTLAIQVEGKSFHPHKTGFDHTKHYGKMVFAHKVIRPNAATIDFRRFELILKVLVNIIDNCTTKNP